MAASIGTAASPTVLPLVEFPCCCCLSTFSHLSLVLLALSTASFLCLRTSFLVPSSVLL